MHSIILQPGHTVTYSSLSRPGEADKATIVEVFENGLAELDTGCVLPVSELAFLATGERWKAIRGYAGNYLLSSWGKVVSTRYKRTSRKRLLSVLHPRLYPSVALANRAGRKQMGINRLVAQHFLPAPSEARLIQVIPKDGNHLNLRAENLQWVDPSEVADKTVNNYLRRCGERHPNNKLTDQQVMQVRKLAAQGISNQQIASQFDVSRSTISLLMNGHTHRQPSLAY